MQFLVLAFALAFSFPAFAATPVMTCSAIQIVDFDENGNMKWEDTGASAEIVVSSEGKRGWIGRIHAPQGDSLEKDVDLVTLPAAEAETSREMATVLLPELDWSTVTSVRVGVINVEANQQDGSGMSIHEILGAGGAVLGKLTQIGWGFGRCQ